MIDKILEQTIESICDKLKAKVLIVAEPEATSKELILLSILNDIDIIETTLKISLQDKVKPLDHIDIKKYLQSEQIKN